MSEFEEEFNNCLHFGFIPNEPQNKIIEHFKDWQPPKPLVVVPEFVADWFEENKHDLEFIVWQYINHWDNQEENEFKTFMDFNVNNPIQTIFKMIDGYTVEKEQLFYLKSKMTGRYLRSYTGLGMDDTTLRYEEVDDRRACGFGGGTTFTQTEIDKLSIGSYEQIEVKVEEVER